MCNEPEENLPHQVNLLQATKDAAALLCSAYSVQL
jgi:hypothetical protein